MDHMSMNTLGNAADAPITPPDAVPDPPSTPLTQPVSAMERLLAEAGIDTSLLPPPDPSKILRFSPSVEHALAVNHQQTHGSMLILQQMFDYYTQRLPDAPDLSTLGVEFLPQIMGVRQLEGTAFSTWKDYSAKMQEKTRRILDERNPWLPAWVIKTSEKPHPWYKAFCDGDNASLFSNEDRQVTFNQIIREATPQGVDPQVALGCPPTENTRFLNEVVDAVSVHLRHFATSFGEDPDTAFEFRWAATIVLFAGLGFEVLRRVALRLQDLDPDWAGVAMASEADLRRLVIQCRHLSGYPVGLLRVPAEKIFAFFENIELKQIPRPLYVLLALHLLKHVRYISQGWKGGDALLVMFDGRYAVLPISSSGFRAPMSSVTNASVFHVVCRMLRTSADDRKDDGEDTMRRSMQYVLNVLCPCHLLHQSDVAEFPHLIAPPCTEYTPNLETRCEYRWANHGMRVGPIGSIDLDTGRVDAQTYIDDEDAIAVSFGFADFNPTTYESWKLMLPEQVQPELPSSHLMRIVKNLNVLGHPVGFAGMIDTTMLIASSRPALAGTVLGAPLANEFPFVVSLPTGSTKEETTQQGKTNVVRVLANVLVPGLKATIVPTRQSAPGDRAVTRDMSTFGTMIADELHVRGNDGIINITSLQGLLTGGVIAPGKAGENADPIGLKYPFFGSMKFNDVPPDIRNRQAPIFLDALTDANRANDKESNLLLSGPLAVHIRLSLALWKHKNNFIERVRDLTWTASKGWRFPAHYLVAQHILGAGEAVVAYLQAAEAMCEQQLREAEASGTVMDTGGAPKFDPAWFFRNCSELTLDRLYKQQLNGPLTSGEMLKEIIEDGGRREYLRELKSVGRTEQGAASAFAQKTNGLTSGDWTLTFYVGKDGASRERKFAKLTRKKTGGDSTPPAGTMPVDSLAQSSAPAMDGAASSGGTVT